jgi:hypothetical protein
MDLSNLGNENNEGREIQDPNKVILHSLLVHSLSPQGYENLSHAWLEYRGTGKLTVTALMAHTP